jgi:hypothetical protein
MDRESSTLEISLVPESGDPSDSGWQEECRRLCATLQREARTDIAIVPRSVSGEVGSDSLRGFDAVTFSTLILTCLKTDAASGAARRLWDVLRAWLDRRRGCRCVITTPDAQYVFENLTQDELLKLMRRRRDI